MPIEVFLIIFFVAHLILLIWLYKLITKNKVNAGKYGFISGQVAVLRGLEIDDKEKRKKFIEEEKQKMIEFIKNPRAK